MSIEAMKMALEALERHKPKISEGSLPVLTHDAAITALRAAIEQAEKPVAWRWKALVNGEFVSNWVLTHSEPPPYATESIPLYAAPRQEHYDQTALELCKECGWRAMIPGDGCLVCARQKAVAYMYDFMSDNEVIRDWVTQSQEDIKRENGFNVRPLYTAPREWVGLTEIEICDIEVDELPSASSETFSFARAIEAKLKEKNHAG